MRANNHYFVGLGILLMCSIAAAQSGGNFTITKSVIAGGGGNSAGGVFVVDGTIGQSAAGTTSTGGTFRLSSGFWGGEQPVSSNVTVSGRVVTSGGLGLRNAIVVFTDTAGAQRTATTSSFGIFTLENVMTGFTYTISVRSKRYRFAPRIMQINSALDNVDFVGLE